MVQQHSTKPTKPLPNPNEDTKPYWEFCKKHELRMQKCRACGRFRYPVSFLCPYCNHKETSWEKLSGKGKVYSFIVVHRAHHPAFAGTVPYIDAIIELEEGVRMLTNIVGCSPEAVRVGLPVEVVFEDISDYLALPQFRPA